MKYLIISVLFLSSAYAEKERGGGSLDRLLFHAGAVVEVQPKITKDHDIQTAFFSFATKFIDELRERRDRRQYEYRNSSGHDHTLTDLDFAKVQNAFYELQKKGISIHKKIESARGDPITFINNSKDMSLIVSQTEFERIMNIGNRELREGLASALVGHELLSLVEIENSDHYPVSAVLAENVLYSQVLLTCITPSMVKAVPIIVEKSEKRIRYLGTPLAFPIEKIKVNLEEFGKRIAFESNAEGFKVRLTQINDNFFLDYEQARTLPGGREDFIISDLKRLWCKPSLSTSNQSANNLPPTYYY